MLNRDRQAIAGLYACGNDMASMMCGTYPGPGTTLGPGVVFAYRAAMHAAGKPPLEDAIGSGRNALGSMALVVMAGLPAMTIQLAEQCQPTIPLGRHAPRRRSIQYSP